MTCMQPMGEKRSDCKISLVLRSITLMASRPCKTVMSIKTLLSALHIGRMGNALAGTSKRAPTSSQNPMRVR